MDAQEPEPVGPREVFKQAARIRTNDPDRPSLELSIRGTVWTSLEVEPEQVFLSDLKPGTAATAEVAPPPVAPEAFAGALAAVEGRVAQLQDELRKQSDSLARIRQEVSDFCTTEIEAARKRASELDARLAALLPPKA